MPFLRTFPHLTVNCVSRAPPPPHPNTQTHFFYPRKHQFRFTTYFLWLAELLLSDKTLCLLYSISVFTLKETKTFTAKLIKIEINQRILQNQARISELQLFRIWRSLDGNRKITNNFRVNSPYVLYMKFLFFHMSCDWNNLFVLNQDMACNMYSWWHNKLWCRPCKQMTWRKLIERQQ